MNIWSPTSDKSIDQTNVPTHLGSSCLILDDCFLFLDQELNLDRKKFWQYSNLCRRYPIVMSHRLLFELITLVVVRVNSISQSHSLVPGWSMIIICYNVTLCQILPGHGVLLLLLLLPLGEGAHQLLPPRCQLSRSLVGPEKVDCKSVNPRRQLITVGRPSGWTWCCTSSSSSWSPWSAPLPAV